MSDNDLNAEVDLVSFISLLSALICSLLLTAVWVHIGTMDVKQAMGGQAVEEKQSEPSLYVNIDEKGNLALNLQDAPKGTAQLKQFKAAGLNGRYDTEALIQYLTRLKQKVPNLHMALIQPQKDVVYEDIVSLMDDFKKQEVKELGIVPF